LSVIFIFTERIFHFNRADFSFLQSWFCIFTERIFHFYWACFLILQSRFIQF
jgi:hypothetical protein